MIVGVLALQGSFLEHEQMLDRIGVEHKRVKMPSDVEGIQGIILPGGESTAISLMWDKNGLYDALRKKIESKNIAAYGTCAGAILLSKKVTGKKVPHSLGVLDIEIQRNAYGSQLGSFIENITIPKISKEPVEAMFIRAPIISSVCGDAEILAKNSRNEIVIVQQDNVLASTFHPELTDNESIHRYFMKMCRDATINN